MKETVFWNTITWFKIGKETYKLKRSIAVRRETAQLLPLYKSHHQICLLLVRIRLRTRKCDVKPANSTTARILGFEGNKTVMRKHLHQVIGAVVYFTSL